MKAKTEYLVLVAVIIGLCALIYTRNNNRLNYTLPDTGGLKAGDIAKIEIVRPGENKTVLLKKNGRWFIMPKERLAKASDADGMAQTIAGLTLTTLVAEKHDDPRYGLSDKDALGVTAFSSDGKVLRKIFVGKQAPSYNHTFVRLDGDPRVYHARGRLGDVFDKTADELRDKTVLAFEKDLVSSITLAKGGKTYSIEKKEAAPAREAAGSSKGQAVPAKAGEAWIVSGTGKKADGDTVEHLLSELYKLQCKKFSDDKKPGDLGDPVCRITLSTGEKHTLSIFSPADGDDDYPATSSKTGQVFLLPGYKAKRIVEEVSAITEK
ncbi:MAG: hypothetical protein B5M56_00250 [Desulfococcus sp. 4484_241]|nr:MAG: hypothetical protein B5M56_00250 [Desulfococcus sp. 4484_241]